KALSTALAGESHQIFELVRHKAPAGTQEIEWHPTEGVIQSASLEDFDAVIHLAGENIAEGRWTDDKKRRIYDSRVKGTQLLSSALASLAQKPAVFLCASATGFYGNRGDQVLDENAAAGSGFLAKVCRDWEKATDLAKQAGIPVVNLRFG